MSESGDAAPRQMNVVHLMNKLRDLPAASPYYFKKVNSEAADGGILRFDKHFNPELAEDSKYFNNMKTFLSCVEKNVDKVQNEGDMEKVCAKEFKNLRLRGFDNELMYHNVNRRFFVNELAVKKNESPY